MFRFVKEKLSLSTKVSLTRFLIEIKFKLK